MISQWALVFSVRHYSLPSCHGTTTLVLLMPFWLSLSVWFVLPSRMFPLYLVIWNYIMMCLRMGPFAVIVLDKKGPFELLFIFENYLPISSFSFLCSFFVNSCWTDTGISLTVLYIYHAFTLLMRSASPFSIEIEVHNAGSGDTELIPLTWGTCGNV